MKKMYVKSCVGIIFLALSLLSTCTTATLFDYFIEARTVKTRLGRIVGTTASSRNGNMFYSFTGIPYAEPPIGNLRFKPPVALKPWHGEILDATNEAPACIQKNYLFEGASAEGSEDCLYLNVYTPEIHFKETSRRLPVLVFIHWGGFFAGYSTGDYLGPMYFMDEPVVLVTFNYRLGALGFLSTNDDAAPGNYGLKDQVAALEWIRDNIEYFAGDKQKITLFGQSAGGASVHYHMLSPLSKGLFHRAISQSGTALALWAQPHRQQLDIARMQATFVGCGHVGNSSQALVDCLRTVKAEDLIESGDKFKYFSVDPLVVYMISIERKTITNPKPFLTMHPLDYIQRGHIQKVPWIVGMVADEGILRAAPLLSQSETRATLNADFNKLMPAIIGLFLSTPQNGIQAMWQQIRTYYLDGDESIDVNNTKSIQGFVNLYTDRLFAYAMYQSALLHSVQAGTNGSSPIWLYNFNYRGQYTYGKVFAATSEHLSNYKWGVSHCDDLLYLFPSLALFPYLNQPTDMYVSRLMVRLWTNFANFGNPTPSEVVSSNDSVTPSLQWLSINGHSTSGAQHFDKNVPILNIYNDFQGATMSRKNGSNSAITTGVTLQMQSNFYNERFRFWEQLPLVENIPRLQQTHIDL